MEIKNIRQFRNYYKKVVRDIDSLKRNENFIGSKNSSDGESEYGFFEIYHGDKVGENGEGIRGFLEGFLDMARDGQAIYEFLQNAVDANSTHFSLFWDKDNDSDDSYLLVLNNGYQFDFKSIRSILNVGVSTKTPEQHTIGKFGIGFKLAHRLVGKENGLNELINKNYGPILFSWKNGEVFDFFSDNIIEPIEQGFKKLSENEHTCEKNTPWLFKILITNFPCQPEEEILDFYHNRSIGFPLSEVDKMKSWINKYISHLSIDYYQEGSLFFIRLGEGKIEHLKEAELSEGLRFSMSILNETASSSVRGIEKMNINGKEIERVKLTFLKFSISKEKDQKEFDWIKYGKNEELTDEEIKSKERDSDIEILMGYTTYLDADELLRNAPNFYLYFPLSAEKHRIKFILHSNAFYKSSSRTSLHVGTEGTYSKNERILSVFAKKLIDHLNTLKVSDREENLREFLDIYSILLISDKSEYDVWINRPLLDSLFEYLENNIPIHSHAKLIDTYSDRAKVKIKKTLLPIYDFDWIPYFFFYWDDEPLLLNQAKEKLKLDDFTLLDILEIENSYKSINDLIDKDYLVINTILEELNIHIQEAEPSNTILDNIYHLKIFEFHEKKLLSINELIKEDNWEYLINFDKITELHEYLETAGFYISSTDLSKYTLLQTFIRNRQKVRYISNYNYLNELLSRKFISCDYSIEEKIKIFKIIERIAEDPSAEDRNKRMQVLKLFKNRTGSVVAIHNLCDLDLSNYFHPFRIEDLPDDFDNIQRYIVKSEKELYDRVIYPLWDSIISISKSSIIANPSAFYNEVARYFQNSSREKHLGDKRILLVDNEFVVNSESIAYHAAFKNITDDKYSSLSSVFSRLFKYSLPEFSTLPYLSQAPFSLSNFDDNSLLLKSEFEVTSKEVIALGSAFQEIGFKIFDNYILNEREGKLYIRPKKEGEFQVWTITEEGAIEYIKNYHHELFLLPNIPVLKDTVEYKGLKIFRYLITKLDFNDNGRIKKLINIIKSKDSQLTSYLLDLIPQIHINLNEENWHTKIFPIVDLVCRIDDLAEVVGRFQEKTKITSEEREFILSTLTQGVGENTIYLGENKEYRITLSEIFPDDQINDAAIIDSIFQKLQLEGIIDQAKLKKVFNISQEINIDDILNEINRWHYENGYLKNASHLAYILIVLNEEEFDYGDYRILSGGKGIELKGKFACSKEDFPLFKDECYLDDRYIGIDCILNLDHNTPSFKSNGFEIYYVPELIEDRIKCPELKNLDSNECLLLFDHLINYKYFPERIFLSQDWEDVIGFNPNHAVVFRHRINDEELPNFILNWLNQESQINQRFFHKKRIFLSSIGIKFHYSSICNIRSILLQDDHENRIDPREIENIEPVLLENTLALLLAKHQNYQFETSDDRFKYLKKIFTRLIVEDRSISILPQSSGVENQYILHKFSESDFYLDHSANEKLNSYGLTKSDLITNMTNSVYDLTVWPDNELIKGKLNEITIIEKIDTSKLQEDSVAWDKHFYSTFSSFHPSIVINQIVAIPILLHVGESLIGSYSKQSIIKHDEIIYVTNQFSDTEILNRIEEEGLIDSKVLNDLKQEFHQYKSRIEELFDSNSPTGKLIRDRLDEIRKEAEIQANKETIKENLGRNKYSFGWFKNFIEIQILQGKSADNYAPEHDIDFYKIERDPESDRLFILSDPNRTITPTIEYCADFHATLFRTGGGSLEVNLQGVSKKGQTLWGQLSNPNELQDIDLNQIKRIKLHFSREIDLLNRLLNAFKALGHQNDWDEKFCLKTNLSENIKFYFGPPGTGKTTKVSEEIISQMANGNELKILVLTPTNKSADVLSEKILQKSDFQSSWLIRYGACFSSEIIERGYHYDANTLEINRFKSMALITTIHRYPYEEILISQSSGEKKRLCNIPWDIIFFDEASMIPVTYSAFAIYQSELINSDRANYLFAGDPLQIPPVIDISNEDLPDDFTKEENIYTLIDLNSFDPEKQQEIPKYGNRIINLNKQYRSNKLIGDLFSNFSYSELIYHAREEGLVGNPKPIELPLELRKIITNPVQFIRFPVNNEDSIYKPNKLRLSPYHFHSAIFTTELIRFFNKEVNDETPWNVGIICPYKSQATLVNKMVESIDLKSNVSVTTDTVHGFQGDECDIVFFLISPSSDRISLDQRLFLHKHYLVNVAISRAKDYLVILYPDEETAGIGNLYKIHKTHPNSVENILIEKLNQELSQITMHSSQVESFLFGDPYHIQNNIFTNQHQLINVYARAEKKYMVKESSTAIDVQLREE